MSGRSTADPRAALRMLRAHRRLLAAACAAAAVAAGLRELAPVPPSAVPVLVAARDLTSGSRIAGGDVAVRELPAYAVPTGALRPGATVEGAVLSGAVRRGEPLTDVRLLGPGLLAAGAAADLRAVPVRVADPGAAALLRVGDRVDVLAARGSELALGGSGAFAPAEVVAADVPVLAVHEPQSGEAALGALLVVGAAPDVARALAGAASAARLSIAIRPAR